MSWEIKFLKLVYYCNLIEESKGDFGLVWKVVSEVFLCNVSLFIL